MLVIYIFCVFLFCLYLYSLGYILLSRNFKLPHSFMIPLTLGMGFYTCISFFIGITFNIVSLIYFIPSSYLIAFGIRVIIKKFILISTISNQNENVSIAPPESMSVINKKKNILIKGIIFIILAVFLFIRFYDALYYGLFKNWDDRFYYSYISRAYFTEGVMNLTWHMDNFPAHGRYTPFLIHLFTGVRLFTGEVETDYSCIFILLIIAIQLFYYIYSFFGEIFEKNGINRIWALISLFLILFSNELSFALFVGYTESSSIMFFFASLYCYLKIWSQKNENKNNSKIVSEYHFLFLFFAVMSWWTRPNMMVYMIFAFVFDWFIIITKSKKNEFPDSKIDQKNTILKNVSVSLLSLSPFIFFYIINRFTWFHVESVKDTSWIEILFNFQESGISLLFSNLRELFLANRFFYFYLIIGFIFVFIVSLKFFIQIKKRTFSLILEQLSHPIAVLTIISILFFGFWFFIHLFLPYEYAYTSGIRYFYPCAYCFILIGYYAMIIILKKYIPIIQFKMKNPSNKIIASFKNNSNHWHSILILSFIVISSNQLIWDYRGYSPLNSSNPSYAYTPLWKITNYMGYYLETFDNSIELKNDNQNGIRFIVVNWADKNLPINCSILIPNSGQILYRMWLNDFEPRYIYGPNEFERDGKRFYFSDLDNETRLESKLNDLNLPYLLISDSDLEYSQIWSIYLEKNAECLFSYKGSYVYQLN